MLRFLRLHGPTAAYALLIFALSSIPSLRAPDMGFSFQDKILHMLEFGILGMLLMRSLDDLFDTRKKVILWTILAGTVYAGMDELHQALVPGRECSWGDFFADETGILLSVVLSVFVFGRLFRSSYIFLLTFK